MTREALLKLAKNLMKNRIAFDNEKVGEFEVKKTWHMPGSKLAVVNYREALFTGLPVTNIEVRVPIATHSLNGPGGCWMTDMPCELVQMHRELAVHAKGRVLIGGLGLGIVAKMVSEKASVSATTVVEIDQDVVKLVSHRLPKAVETVQADLFEFLKDIKRDQFTCALLDTWQSTGEMCWTGTVVPLRRLIGTKIPRVRCWQEGVMHGQIWQVLPRVADMDAEIFNTVPHYYAFRKAIVKSGIRSSMPKIKGRWLEDFSKVLEIGEENGKDDQLVSLARLFLYTVGSPIWEELFGEFWDEAVSKKPS